MSAVSGNTITLLTDFGTVDYFAAALKGVLLSAAPGVSLIDITHEIPAHDIHAGAFTLGACWHTFPAGTIHLAVVDPGVGSERRVIVVRADGHYFVGPDNGLFSFVYARASDIRVWRVTRTDLFRQPVSATFHGRDVFAPLAARLARGMPPEQTGAPVLNYQRFEMTAPSLDTAGNLCGEIIHIDRFGNCVTSLTTADLAPEHTGPWTRLVAGDCVVRNFVTHYAAAPGAELMAYPGSAGYWEIALWQDAAAARFHLARGAVVSVQHGPIRHGPGV
ncbi:MAG: S-adenosyl-l-methionine hydroxide adenosyltransferase family protein [Blastocatellia bacterium]